LDFPPGYLKNEDAFFDMIILYKQKYCPVTPSNEILRRGLKGIIPILLKYPK
jgi:hypothetical protein